MFEYDEEVKSVLESTKENVVKYLLNKSKLSSERRGSITIREIDVKYAIDSYKHNTSSNKFYYIPVAGNGGCLFTSIRLSMELSYVLNKIDEGNPIDKFVLNGHSENMLQASNNIRNKIVEWFRRFLTREIPQLGNYTEGSNGRKYQRGDLLALEMVRNGKDVPETGPERESIILKYLLHMSLPSTWGSTPEYTAAACMTGKRINIWQDGADGLFIINSINGKLIQSDSENVLNTDFKDFIKLESTINETDSDEVLISKDDDAENDAVLYDDEEINDFETSDNDINDDENEDDNENDLCYNLYFRNNHYMPLVTRTQYLKLISVYSIDKINNFKELS